MAFVAEPVLVGCEDPHVDGMPIRLYAVLHVVNAKLHLLRVFDAEMAPDAQNRVEEARVVAVQNGGTPSLDPHASIGLRNLLRPLLEVDEFPVSPLECSTLSVGVDFRPELVEVVEVVVRVELAKGVTGGTAIDQGPKILDSLLLCEELSFHQVV